MQACPTITWVLGGLAPHNLRLPFLCAQHPGPPPLASAVPGWGSLERGLARCLTNLLLPGARTGPSAWASFSSTAPQALGVYVAYTTEP